MSSVEDIVREREDYEELLSTAGWRRFVRRATEEWKGDGFFSRVGTALKSTDPTDAKVVYKTALEIERLMNYPTDRVRELKGIVED